MREIKVPSVVPVYLAGAVWAVYALLFPLYKLSHFGIALGCSAAVYLIASRLIPPIVRRVEERPPEPVLTGDPELDETLRQWRAFLQELRRLAGRIGQPDMKRQLASLLELSERIMEAVSDSPWKRRQIRQLSSYYGPTVLSLLKRYAGFEENTVKGENIASAMKEIETVMDRVVAAFGQALDKLYHDEALDVEVEIDVLEKMLQQDGLQQEQPFAQFTKQER